MDNGFSNRSLVNPFELFNELKDDYRRNPKDIGLYSFPYDYLKNQNRQFIPNADFKLASAGLNWEGFQPRKNSFSPNILATSNLLSSFAAPKGLFNRYESDDGWQMMNQIYRLSKPLMGGFNYDKFLNTFRNIFPNPLSH